MEVIRRRLLPKHSRTSVSRRSWWTRAQRASYLFRPFTAQTSGCTALRFYTMDQDGLRPSRTGETPMVQAPDRKSTRLNSSHQIISYAVFCLKKKTNNDYVASNTLTAYTYVTYYI